MSKLFIPFFTVLTLTTAHANPPEDLYEAAILSSPLVKQMHEEGVKRRIRERMELQVLLNYVKSNPEKEHLKTNVGNALDREKSHVRTLDEDLKAFDPLDPKPTSPEEKVLFQLIYHKMGIGLEKAKTLFDVHFDDILEGKLPEGYCLTPPKMNAFPNETHIYSTGRGRALKQLLLTTAMECKEMERVVYSPTAIALPLSALDKVPGFSIAGSAFIHTVPLPSSLKWKYRDSAFMQGGLAVVHNGYAFGGQRGENEQRRFGPQDCSSLLAKHLDCLPFSTYHQATWHQDQLGFFFKDSGPVFAPFEPRWRDEIRPLYSKDREYTAFSEKTIPITVSGLQDIQAGMIYTTRSYAGVDQNPEKSLDGKGGHTAVVIGTEGQGPDAKVYVMGAGRDLEGSNKDFNYGVEAFDFMTDPFKVGKKTFYFEVKK